MRERERETREQPLKYYVYGNTSPRPQTPNVSDHTVYKREVVSVRATTSELHSYRHATMTRGGSVYGCTLVPGPTPGSGGVEVEKAFLSFFPSFPCLMPLVVFLTAARSAFMARLLASPPLLAYLPGPSGGSCGGSLSAL